jgi:hypothetical protein
MKITIPSKYKKPIAYSIAALLSIAFITLLILPANYFDTGRATCVSVILFDLECYGCGMTRAIQHLLHLDFEKAYEFNKLSFIVLPLAIIMIAWELKKVISPQKLEQPNNS